MTHDPFGCSPWGGFACPKCSFLKALQQTYLLFTPLTLSSLCFRWPQKRHQFAWEDNSFPKTTRGLCFILFKMQDKGKFLTTNKPQQTFKTTEQKKPNLSLTRKGVKKQFSVYSLSFLCIFPRHYLRYSQSHRGLPLKHACIQIPLHCIVSLRKCSENCTLIAKVQLPGYWCSANSQQTVFPP